VSDLPGPVEPAQGAADDQLAAFLKAAAEDDLAALEEDQVERLVGGVADNPVRALETKPGVVAFHQDLNGDRVTRRGVTRGGHHLEVPGGARQVPEQVDPTQFSAVSLQEPGNVPDVVVADTGESGERGEQRLGAGQGAAL
jgi:hypothetical protein